MLASNEVKMATQRLLVGIDGSEQSAHALEFAINLGRSLGAEVIACHAIGKLTKASDGHLVPLEERRNEIVSDFETKWCAPLDYSGLGSQKIIVDGNPVTTLLTITEEERADMIILGSRRHSIASFLGSTSHQIIEHSPVPVVVVPTRYL